MRNELQSILARLSNQRKTVSIPGWIAACAITPLLEILLDTGQTKIVVAETNNQPSLVFPITGRMAKEIMRTFCLLVWDILTGTSRDYLMPTRSNLTLPTAIETNDVPPLRTGAPHDT